MKIQQILFTSLVITLVAALVSTLMLGLIWPTIPLVIFSVTFILFFRKCFAVNLFLLRQTDELLHKTLSRSKWTFENLDELENNHVQLQKKLEVLADLISNIAHPEKNATALFDSKDPIAKALDSIQQEMKKIKEDENKRAWVISGIATFGEVLRKKSELTTYANNVISNLIRYLNANQGGLFVDQQDANGAHYLELVACYAYEKTKCVENRIEPGQGLLGQCMLEKNFIFITDVPNNYTKISSGLGEATPRNIVVAPLIFNETFCGAIELASFQILQPHQVEFLKKVCEDIASEIISLKTVENTKRLLTESNQLTQELQLREEKMRNNMEALATTQKEMSHKQNELSGIINAIESTVATVELDLFGNFIKANEIFLKVMGFTQEDVQQKLIIDFMVDEAAAVMMWQSLRLGKFFSGEFKMRDYQGKELWLTGTFNPISIGEKEPEKIIMLAQFTTQEKEKLSNLNTMVQAFKSALPMLEFNADFSCKTANEKAIKFFGISKLSLKTKTITDFIAPYYQEVWEMNKTKIVEKEFASLFLPFVANGILVNYEVTISTVRNLDSSISKVIVLLVKEVTSSVSILAIV